MKLSELFENCAYKISYEQTGHGVSYAFVEDKDILYIYFQGSSEVMDWFRNFLFPAKPYKDMAIPYRVHRGFLAAWKEVEDIVIAKITERGKNVHIKPDMNGEFHYIREEEYKWKQIFVIGYSHGAALAGLCHECVWYHRPDLRENGLEGFGFESPRFYGCWFVKKSLKERWAKFTVIRTNNDLVTHCPPWILGFCHVGNMMKVKGDVNLVENKKLPRCIKSHFPQVVLDGLKKEEE